MDKNLQESILDAVNILVKENIRQAKFTTSNIGIVKSVNSSDCTVEVQGNELTCILMEHLEDWIDVDDIVIVHDLYNDNTKKAVMGKVGTTRPTSFTMYDTDKGKAVSGVEQVFDEELGKSIDVVLEVE